MPQLNGKDQQSSGLLSIISYPVVWAADEMGRLNITLNKLMSAQASMKQFDKLEEQGLPKRQVQLMKDAMESKIQMMVDDAINSIKRL